MGDKKKSDQDEKKPSAGQVVKEYAQAIILAVVLALIIRSFIIQPFHIPSGSMIPTFLEGDRVLAVKFSYGIRNPFNNNAWVEVGRPERWDVVIFMYPKEPGKDFVKRVVGLPGEVISMVNGQLFINGRKIDDPYGRYSPHVSPAGRNFEARKIPADHYFMMGDNRDFSSDSREWGPVDASLLRGKAWRLYWSWDSSDPDKNFAERPRFSRIGMKIE